MSVTYTNPDGVHEPGGLYSHLALADQGSLVFISGQVAFDQDREIVGLGDAGAQFEKVFANLVANLESVGAGPGDIVDLKTYLVGRENLAALATAREEVFAEHYPDGRYPPSTLVLVSGLVSPGLLVEVSAVACVPD